MIEPSEEVFDCQSCGKCCLTKAWNYDGGPFVDLSKTDLKRFGKRRLALVSTKTLDCVHATGLSMKTEKGRCVALEGKVGCLVSCSVYEKRPTDCRTFEPGSKLCRQIRGATGGSG